MGDEDANERWDPARAVLPPIPTPPRVVRVRGPESRPPVPITAPRPPGSKYYTLRYLLNALLADGESVVRGPALSDDTAVLVRALRALGADVVWEPHANDPSNWQLRVRGTGGRLSEPPGGVIQAGNAGAVLRLLLGIGALLPRARFETDHPGSLGRRPNADLLAALAALGLSVEAGEPDGRLPITLAGGPPLGGAVAVSGARSSQYLSALLYLAPLLPRGLDITVTETLRSAPLVRAALALGAPLRLERLDGEADDVRALVAALHALGAPLIEAPEDVGDAGDAGGALAVGPDARLTGAVVDGDGCIDSVPALVAAACFAARASRFENVATLRLKESDRIGDLAAELNRAGGDVTPLADAILVRGQPAGIAGGATVDAHDDHRLAQALAIAALRARDGLTITGADAVAKSYPWFFDDLARMGAEVAALEA